MQLDKKQKMMLIITVVALAFLGWQVYDMFAGDMASPTVAPVPKVAVKNTVVAKAPAQPKSVEPKLSSLDDKAPSLPNQQLVTERKGYLSMADQYQMSAMRSKLLQQQITEAQEQEKLLQLNQQLAQLNGGAAPKQYGSTDQQHVFRLSSVLQVNGAWQATVDQNNQFVTVQVGDSLANGGEITMITSTGLYFKLNNKSYLLSFKGLKLMNKTDETLLPVANTQQTAS